MTEQGTGEYKFGIWCRRVLLIFVSLFLVVLIGDFAYSRWVNRRLARWESEQVYDDQGVRQGCQAFSKGEGEQAVLFVHGINDSPRLWDGYADHLSQQGYTCRAMRLPGFATRNQDYAEATLDEWVVAVGKEIDLLAKDHERIHVVAHSLGAAVCVRFESMKPGTLASLNLLAPLVEVSNRKSPVLPTRYWYQFGRVALIFTNTTYNPFGPAVNDPDSRDYPWRVDFTPRTVIDETFRLARENRGRAAQLKSPLFVAISENDDVVDADAARRFYDATQLENKAWCDANKSAHLLPLDLDRDHILKSMLEFWSQLEKQSGEETEVQ